VSRVYHARRVLSLVKLRRLLCVVQVLLLFFFFQAEDGIRDSSVTGVQTCAFRSEPRCETSATPRYPARPTRGHRARSASPDRTRSEERRVGKECRWRWRARQSEEIEEKRAGAGRCTKSSHQWHNASHRRCTDVNA